MNISNLFTNSVLATTGSNLVKEEFHLRKINSKKLTFIDFN